MLFSRTSLHVDVITRSFANVQWIHGFMDNRYDIFMLKTFFIRFAMRRLFIMSVVSLNSVILASVPEEVPNGDSRSSLNSSGEVVIVHVELTSTTQTHVT